MKRFFALLLSAIMLLSFAACSNSGSDKTDDGTAAPTGGSTIPSTQASKEHTIEMFVQEFLELDLRGNVDLARDSLPQEIWDWYESEHGLTYDAAIASYEDYIAGLKEFNERDFGANYQFTFTIDETRELLDGVTTEQVAAALVEHYKTVDASKVTDTRYLVLTVTQSGDSDSLTGTFALNAVQYDGRWYALVISHNAEGKLFANFSSRAA